MVEKPIGDQRSAISERARRRTLLNRVEDLAAERFGVAAAVSIDRVRVVSILNDPALVWICSVWDAKGNEVLRAETSVDGGSNTKEGVLRLMLSQLQEPT